MRKIIIIVILTFTAIFCSGLKEKKSFNEDFLITGLDSIDNYYIIYTQHNGDNYKFISDKCISICKNRILIGGTYNLDKRSIFILNVKDNGIVREVTNHVNIDCMILGETKICKEYDKGIVDIYRSKKLKGLCYIQD